VRLQSCILTGIGLVVSTRTLFGLGKRPWLEALRVLETLDDGKTPRLPWRPFRGLRRAILVEHVCRSLRVDLHGFNEVVSDKVQEQTVLVCVKLVGREEGCGTAGGTFKLGPTACNDLFA
jgi:hypothetical protein